ncbi:hypothetical protein [Spiroplasma poulsonii]|uniref:hypothetical protein n=1 Tax=Spiroplasma poulsonii TaxID=2138 RepID=UPI001F4D127A|nr:hypothetical protein [Spiroplasma poulsonii]UNF62692.1 hypothetical protein MNU24_03605 [Spiroplasma poulsonii]
MQTKQYFILRSLVKKMVKIMLLILSIRLQNVILKLKVKNKIIPRNLLADNLFNNV